jgi:mono/diheme cytochrome c family protein
MQYHVGMKTIIASVSLLLGLGLIGLGLTANGSEPPKTLKVVPAHASTAITGQALFHEYCAVCHGTTAKGDGPAAAALKTKAADLTQISARNGGKYPEIRVQNVIVGDADATMAHGSKDMPIWGNIFHHMGSSSDMANVRVYNLVKYIEELQAK